MMCNWCMCWASANDSESNAIQYDTDINNKNMTDILTFSSIYKCLRHQSSLIYITQIEKLNTDIVQKKFRRFNNFNAGYYTE